jgi:hypothetical protein
LASLTKDISLLLKKLEVTEPLPITGIIEPCRKKDGSFHKSFPSGWKVKSNKSPSLPNGINQGGVYVFWWLKKDECSMAPFKESYFTNKFDLQGKKIARLQGTNKYQTVDIEITEEWLNLYSGHIPLYVGKSADCLLDRIKLHLLINKAEYKRKSTSDQLRRGFNRLFRDHHNVVDLIVKHVGLTYVNLHGKDDVVNRFYLEDLAIGSLRPIFNIDIER